MSTHIIVLGGGDSVERAVSLRSAAAVSAALRANGYTVSQLDPSQPSKDYKQQLQAADIIFPVLHGSGGEDGTLQAWLDSQHYRYIGADAQASADCFDKWRFKQIIAHAGILTPQAELVNKTSLWKSKLIKSPFVLKPSDGGSSLDTFIIRDILNFDTQPLIDVFSRYRTMLLEELIDGKEITIGILLNEVLPVIEIIPPADAEFDYDNKYNGKTRELCPPQSISLEIQQQAQTTALHIHKLLKVRDMSRTDMMIGDDGTLYVLETNTIPGMTTQSLLPKAAAVAGHSMAVVVKRLVEAAQQRSLAK